MIGGVLELIGGHGLAEASRLPASGNFAQLLALPAGMLTKHGTIAGRATDAGFAMSRKRPFLAIAATLVAAMGLSACGSETKSAPGTDQRVYYKCAGDRGFFAAFNAEGTSVAL